MWMLIFGPILLTLGILTFLCFLFGPLLVSFLKSASVEVKNVVSQVKEVWKND